jgi:hypothetical protein
MGRSDVNTKFWSENDQGKRPFERTRLRWEDNIKCVVEN